MQFKNIKGISLVEQLFALTLSCLILSGVITIYLATDHQYHIQNGILSIQENSRVILPFVSRQLQTAGHIGCAKLNNQVSINSSTSFTLSLQNRIESYQDTDRKESSDGFTIRYKNINSAMLINDMTDFSTLQISTESSLKAGDILMISDCQHADIFQAMQSIKQKGSSIILTKKPLQHRYKKNAEISLFEVNHFYIAKTSRSNARDQPVYALFMKNIKQEKLELAEGVDDMQINYAILKNNHVEERRPGRIDDWSEVVGVSIMFEFAAVDAISFLKKEYLYVALR